MRPCAHCQYDNADHLAYCFQCGRRLGAHVRRAGPTAAGANTAFPITAGGSLAVAPTMINRATEPTLVATAPATASPTQAAPLRALSHVRYLFVYLRGRWAAEERKRRLGEEKEGAERLLGSAFSELGQTILREGHSAPDLTGLLEAIGRAQARREGAVADLKSAEQLQAAEDLRQGRRHESAQAAVTAAEEAARELDELLRAAERDVTSAPDHERPRHQQVLETVRQRRQTAQEGLAKARAQLEAVARERRQTAAQISVGLSGHSRERAEAEREIASLTAQLGQAAHQCKLGVPSLKLALGRIERLETTISERTRAIAAIDLSLGHYDKKRVAVGAAILLASLTFVAAGLWLWLSHRGR